MTDEWSIMIWETILASSQAARASQLQWITVCTEQASWHRAQSRWNLGQVLKKCERLPFWLTPWSRSVQQGEFFIGSIVCANMLPQDSSNCCSIPSHTYSTINDTYSLLWPKRADLANFSSQIIQFNYRIFGTLSDFTYWSVQFQ